MPTLFPSVSLKEAYVPIPGMSILSLVILPPAFLTASIDSSKFSTEITM